MTVAELKRQLEHAPDGMEVVASMVVEGEDVHALLATISCVAEEDGVIALEGVAKCSSAALI